MSGPVGARIRATTAVKCPSAADIWAVRALCPQPAGKGI
jgi:hypothetical protein